MDLARPDGARIHYEVRGEGPLVVLALGYAATARTYEGLVNDLERDRRVATWDPRGCGRSSRDGPYDIDTDAGDLIALIHELGGAAVIFAAGHGVVVSTRAAAADPSAVRALVSPGVVTALRGHLGESEGFASSGPVLDMLVEQLRRDPRAAIRATIASLNPQLDEEGLRDRIEEILGYADVETILARVEAWISEDRAFEELRALGDRAAVVWHPNDAWQAGAVPRVRELLPDIHVVEVEDGPLSRPDLTANVVRKMS